jgi:hypothetical protein
MSNILYDKLQSLGIPLHDEHGNLTSLQKIWPDPQISGKFVKGFLKGSRIQGCCFILGLIKDEVVRRKSRAHIGRKRRNGFKTYAALAQHFDTATREYCGTAMTAFVENVIKETDSLRKYFDKALRDSKEKHLPSYANGQDDRVFKFFFTIGFAGELASRYGITGWPAGEALTAAVDEFNRRIEHKGGIGNQEEKMMLEQIKHFFNSVFCW